MIPRMKKGRIKNGRIIPLSRPLLSINVNNRRQSSTCFAFKTFELSLQLRAVQFPGLIPTVFTWNIRTFGFWLSFLLSIVWLWLFGSCGIGMGWLELELELWWTLESNTGLPWTIRNGETMRKKVVRRNNDLSSSTVIILVKLKLKLNNVETSNRVAHFLYFVLCTFCTLHTKMTLDTHNELMPLIYIEL